MYLDGIKTDHRAVYMVVDLNYIERGKGYWKLNTSLLYNLEYITLINKEIESTVELSSHKSSKSIWEDIKKRIKKVTVDFTRSRTSEDRQIIASLSEKINKYESSLPLDAVDSAIYLSTKQDLEDKLFERARGIMFRSKVRWYEEGEKNTKYFFALEKARYNAKTCYKLVDDEGAEHIDPSSILEVQKTFYEKLYMEDKEVNFNLVNTYGIKVSEQNKLLQERMITGKDVGIAMLKMKNNKTPGQDGIPVDFYEVFWEKLKKPFIAMMEECYESNELHLTARKGILNLIPKPNKDSKFVKNLRPITLLNTDYKIMEKAVADKMVPALYDIIHTDQRGFMKDRRISVNIRKMLDIMHEAEVKDMAAVVLSLDFVKCFDRCSFSILHGSLEYFGFGYVVQNWTKILYSKYTVKVQNNGHFSGEIPIEKGVHQGGCCSAIYFLVIAEILAISLRSNEDIDGVVIRNIWNLLNQFADDMDIFSLCNEKSL